MLCYVRSSYEESLIRCIVIYDFTISTDMAFVINFISVTFLLPEVPIHYELPMDLFVEGNMQSPSGLNATTNGTPNPVRGVRKNALMLQGGSHSSALVSRGGTMVHECFFDLTYCREGETRTVSSSECY